MKIEYTLTEGDLLTHQLFLASQSRRVRKRRAQGKIFLMLLYMALGLFIWNRNGPLAAAIFFIICLPLYFMYAYMEKRQYIRYFTRFIREHYQDRVGQTTTLTFDQERLILFDSVNENIVPLGEIESISEIETLYSIHLKTGQAFFIPKSGIELASEMPSFLHQLVDRLNIPLQQELDWKWK